MPIDPKVLAEAQFWVKATSHMPGGPTEAGKVTVRFARALVEAAAEIERLKRDGQEAITEAERAELSRRREEGV